MFLYKRLVLKRLLEFWRRVNDFTKRLEVLSCGGFVISIIYNIQRKLYSSDLRWYALLLSSCANGGKEVRKAYIQDLCGDEDSAVIDVAILQCLLQDAIFEALLGKEYGTIPFGSGNYTSFTLPHSIKYVYCSSLHWRIK